MKFLIVLVFVGILTALATAGVFMMRDGRDGQRKSRNMMRALAWRVGLSVALFAFILFSYWIGWIEPTGIPVGR